MSWHRDSITSRLSISESHVLFRSQSLLLVVWRLQTIWQVLDESCHTVVPYRLSCHSHSKIQCHSIACVVTDPHPNGSKVDWITMALLIVFTGQLAINLVKCTILTGGACKYSSNNTILFGNNCRYIPILLSLAQASWELSTLVASMPFWGCVHRNASLQVNFEPETMPVLILSTQVNADTYLPSMCQHWRLNAALHHHCQLA